MINQEAANNLSLSVCVKHDDRTYEVLYDYIPSWEEADLLAQYAMNMKDDENDLIFIFPGWNRGIDKRPDLWEKACALAQEYRTESKRYFL